MEGYSAQSHLENLSSERLVDPQAIIEEQREKIIHLETRVNNQTEIISKIITIGKSKEQKASRNFQKVIDNIQTDSARTFMFRKLVASTNDKDLLLSWNDILLNSIPE